MLFEGGAESIEKFLTPVIRTNLLPQLASERPDVTSYCAGAQTDSPSSQPQNQILVCWMPLQAPNAHKHLMKVSC